MKPYCFDDKKYSAFMWVIIESLTKDLINLDKTDVNLTGLYFLLYMIYLHLVSIFFLDHFFCNNYIRQIYISIFIENGHFSNWLSIFVEVSSFSSCKRGAWQVLVLSLLRTCDQNIFGSLFN